jgi:hypothetical protein
MRKFVFIVLAALLPICAGAQTSASSTGADDNPKASRYDIFVGAGATSQNQIVHSHGWLIGVEVGVTRNWGKYFGLNVQGASFFASTSSANTVDGVSPQYSQFLAGPELHAQIYNKVSGNVHVLVGGSHTGGTGITGTPDVAFSTAVGAGLDYRLKPHFSLRLTGDRVGTSFVQGASGSGNSPHPYANVQTALGVVYHW